jgi:hypothetical protein
MRALCYNGKTYQVISTNVKNVVYLYRERNATLRSYFYIHNGCLHLLSQNFDEILGIESQLERLMSNQITMDKDALKKDIFNNGECYFPSAEYLIKAYGFTQDEVDKMKKQVDKNRKQRDEKRRV